MRSPETPLLCALFYLKGPASCCYWLSVHNLSYVLYLSFKAVLSRLAAVLYYMSRVRYCLSALVYAGVSLFIIIGPCVCLVVRVVYVYNLAYHQRRFFCFVYCFLVQSKVTSEPIVISCNIMTTKVL